nr:XRE family transcriptional regulator [Microbacterium hydrocarbonoxydans]
MTTHVRRAVAEAVVRELAAAGETAPWLADRSGIAVKTLQAKLASRRDFTVTELASIADVLGIPIASLVPPVSES